jgi:hypothetical protein
VLDIVAWKRHAGVRIFSHPSFVLKVKVKYLHVVRLFVNQQLSWPNVAVDDAQPEVEEVDRL